MFVNILLLFLNSIFFFQRWHSRPKLCIFSFRENGIEVEIFNIFLQISLQLKKQAMVPVHIERGEKLYYLGI